MKKLLIYFLLIVNVFYADSKIDDLLKSDSQKYTTAESNKDLVKKSGKVEKIVGQAFLQKDVPFLCPHAHFFVEVFCRGVSCPDVQRHLIAALLFCLLLHIFKQAFPDMLSSCLLIDAQIVDEQ